jgi:predicted ATPase/class 3 adenylate cyclase
MGAMPTPATPGLPSGTVTFAFTDIEGSTARWERDRSAMERTVRRHDEIMRRAIAARGGLVFKTVGDAFCAAFERPQDAVAAMLEAQRAIAAEDFSAVGGLRVRAAIHTGTADERDGDYFGTTVNRVARLLSIAHGGQILMSGVTSSLVDGALPSTATLSDLGEHRLKDLMRPERVHQLVAPGLQAVFPPLRSFGASLGNVPATLSSFVGRASELTAIRAILGHARLLTVVGPGGVGKTRTVVEIATEAPASFADGVWFVDLAPLRDPEFVDDHIAATLGLVVAPGRNPAEIVTAYLATRHCLLVIDNCEHLIDEVARVVRALLHACPRVTILATSREALRLSGERIYRMPSLDVPPAHVPLTAAEALAYGAVALFCDRARAADGRFALTDDNAGIVAEICRRLDGIALALELAAPRVKVLSVGQLSHRLTERFRLLTGGNRSALPRQQTLRALIDWSYDLLPDVEKAFFRRTGIFAGGFTLDAAVAICAGTSLADEWNVLDTLSTLVDKSLVVAETVDDRQRYRLLESLRDYAYAKLEELGETNDVAEAHAHHYLALARAGAVAYQSTPVEDWLASMSPEIENYRAALTWSLAENPALGADLAVASWFLFDGLGSFEEGIRWIDAALASAAALSPDARAKLHESRMILLVRMGGRFVDALAETERVLATGTRRRKVVLNALSYRLFLMTMCGELGAVEPEVERVVAVASGGDAFDEAIAMMARAFLPASDAQTREGLASACIATFTDAMLYRLAAGFAFAWAALESERCSPLVASVAARAVDLARAADGDYLARCLGMHALALLDLGDTARAVERAYEQLESAVVRQNSYDCRTATCIIVGARTEFGDPIEAARLLGYADIAQPGTSRSRQMQFFEALREKAIARVVTELGRPAFETFAREGSLWTDEVAYFRVQALRDR